MLQICLAEHAALACVRGCSADLENLSARMSAAQIQVPQQGSKKRQQGTCTASQADEESCAELLNNIELRDRPSAKVGEL